MTIQEIEEEVRLEIKEAIDMEIKEEIEDGVVKEINGKVEDFKGEYVNFLGVVKFDCIVINPLLEFMGDRSKCFVTFRRNQVLPRAARGVCALSIDGVGV